jgi:hypothetical protein
MFWYFVLATLLVGCCVSIHYETLQFAARIVLPRLHLRPSRLLVIVGVITCMLAHVAEIWLFALALYVLDGVGLAVGYVDSGQREFLDFLNNSADSYTSLGYVDTEHLTQAHHLLSGVEALTGLVMIGWTASFTFLLMERYWRQRHGPR